MAERPQVNQLSQGTTDIRSFCFLPIFPIISRMCQAGPPPSSIWLLQSLRHTQTQQ